MFSSITPNYSIGFNYDHTQITPAVIEEGQFAVASKKFDKDSIIQQYYSSNVMPLQVKHHLVEIGKRTPFDAWVVGREIMIRKDAEMSLPAIERIKRLQSQGYQVREVTNESVMPSEGTVYAEDASIDAPEKYVSVVDTPDIKPAVTYEAKYIWENELRTPNKTEQSRIARRYDTAIKKIEYDLNRMGKRERAKKEREILKNIEADVMKYDPSKPTTIKSIEIPIEAYKDLSASTTTSSAPEQLEEPVDIPPKESTLMAIEDEDVSKDALPEGEGFKQPPQWISAPTKTIRPSSNLRPLSTKTGISPGNYIQRMQSKRPKPPIKSIIRGKKRNLGI